MKGMIRMNNELIPNDNNNQNYNQLQNSSNFFQSPSIFLKKIPNENLEKLKKENELDKFDMASNLIKNNN